jgi:hypothetical protein
MYLLNKYSGAIFLFFLHLTLYGQVSEASFTDKFNNYSNRALQEKIFVHTDKEFYVAGEIVWFKVYYINGTTHKPLQLSKIAYVEIINEKNEPVSQSKVSLRPGESDGSFYLPVSLNTGNYILRAYTSWMRNFSEEYFFEKKITIVNTLKEAEPTSIKDTTTATIGFFPEGGNLVDGMESRVGFSVTNEKGSINNCQGFIIANNNDTVVRFSPLKFGMGHFRFTPVLGNDYKAKIVLADGKVITKGLPPIYANGYVMNISESGPQQIAIVIKRKRMAGEQAVHKVLLAAHTRQVLKITESASINDNDSIRLVIDKNRLDKGITHFTLFADNNKPVCERLIFIKPDKKITASVAADAVSYDQRKKINLTVDVAGNTAYSSFNLSASVFTLDDLQKNAPAGIDSYMWLTSDLSGVIESPEFYFSDDPDVAAVTDNLMLTHGWRRFKWEDIWRLDNSFVKFLPETDGHLVTGEVIDSRNGRPVPRVNTSLTVLKRPFGFYTSASDANGIVRFNIKDYYGNGQVILQRGLGIDSFYTVNLLSPFAERTLTQKSGVYRFTEDLRQQILQRSVGMQVQNMYIGDSMRNFKPPVVTDTLPFYGIAEKTYMLDDYKRFTTIEEVLREYVLEIGVMLRNGKPTLRIFNPEAHDFYRNYELVLLDGVMLRDFNKIFSYDPLKVKKLDIIQTRYILGQSVFNGIASFSTYEGRFDGFELDPKIVAIDYAGLQLQREFYSPVYETKEQIESRVPDFRTTLYWAPDITTGTDGKAKLQFYSSDRSGKYMVVLQGVNEQGEFISATTTFEVK